MSITVGMSSAGAKYRVLRLTMGGADIALAQSYWGERPTVSYTAEALGDGRWLFTFRPDRDGNVGHIQRLPRGNPREYMSWSWAARDPNALLGVPPIRKRAHRGELLQWHDDGRLEIIVRGERVKPRRVKPAAPAPSAPLPVLSQDQSSSGLRRLAALRDALNAAIAEFKGYGVPVKVTQLEPGDGIAVNIDIS